MKAAVLGVTLARGGSKGVPNKNVYPLLGRPLLSYTVEEALKSEHLSKYVVSSDSPEILAVAAEWGAETLQRPLELAQDDTPSVSALQHALAVREALDGPYDIVADIRCTNPLKVAEDIDRAIRILWQTGADAVVGVRQVTHHHPCRLKQMCDGRLVDVWPEPPSGQRQEIRPPVYIRDGGIYVVLAEALKDGILFQGGDIRGYIMPPERCGNVDDEYDLLVLEAMLRRRNDSGG